MIKKILILATVTLTFALSGCNQELPPVEKPQQIDKPAATQPVENPKPVENPQPVENPKTQTPAENTQPAENSPPVENPTVVSPVSQSQAISLKIYYPDDAGINLVGVNRTIEVKNDSEKYIAAVRLLMKNPEEKDLTVIFPKNAKINSVKVENGTAYVDFDKNITKSFVGGSTGEELLVNSVVKTLGEFSEVQQVRFLIDGAEIETLSGHMDLSEPIKKSDV